MFLGKTAPNILCFSIALCAALSAAEPEDTLRTKLDRFPHVEPGKDENRLARFQKIEAPAEAVAIGGFHYHAFRFTAPEWLNGNMAWMFVLPDAPDTAAEGFSWAIAPVKGGESIQPPYQEAPVRAIEGLPTLFPKANQLTVQALPHASLKAGADYLVWYRAKNARLPRMAAAFTVMSDKGRMEWGNLPVRTGFPELSSRANGEAKPGEPKQLVAAITTEYQAKGKAAALTMLDGVWKEYLAAGGRQDPFFFALWKEAQVRSGRADLDWASELWDWLFLQAIAVGNDRYAKDVLSNAMGGMANAYRFGRQKEILAWHERTFWRSGFELDTAAYPDLGPGIAALPEVRRRDIPFEAPIGFPWVNPDGKLMLFRGLERFVATAVNSMAADRERSGRWREAMEWRLWVQAWSDHEQAENPHYETVNVWYEGARGNVDNLENLGLYEAAREDHRRIIADPREDAYNNRSRLLSRLGLLNCALRMGQFEPGFTAEAALLCKQVRENIYLVKSVWFAADLVHARCLLASGQTAAAMKQLDELVAEGHEPALFQRCRLKIDSGALAGVEQDLLRLLDSYRGSGRKILEARLYSLYADFLEKSNRLAEAVAMRREALRLMEGFDLFVDLPQELARLAVLLARCGDERGSKLAAERALALASRTGRIPPRVAALVRSILATMPAVSSNDKKGPSADLQPVSATVLPLEGRPMRGLLTIANLTDKVVEGTLAFEGLPVSATWSNEKGHAEVTMGRSGADRLSKLRIDPASFIQAHLSTPADQAVTGELIARWSSAGAEDQTSTWTFESAETGVFTAIIDAGTYKRNSFYGVPIHHHYQAPPGSAYSGPLRVLCSLPARVEIYDAANHPVCIDATGNGDFGQSGDLIYQDGDSDGSPDLRMQAGEAILRLQVYPSGELPADGMKVTIQSKVEGTWHTFAEDKLVP